MNSGNLEFEFKSQSPDEFLSSWVETFSDFSEHYIEAASELRKYVDTPTKKAYVLYYAAQISNLMLGAAVYAEEMRALFKEEEEKEE